VEPPSPGSPIRFPARQKPAYGPTHNPIPGPRDGSVNDSVNWDDFDPGIYYGDNYRQLRDDDQQIIRAICDFFRATGISSGRALDVGTGANIYPALAMLPICTDLTLWEHSASNVAWLHEEVAHFSALWQPFWDEVCAGIPAANDIDPRAELASRARVRRGSIFGLPRRRWDLGTMSFVAESMTTSRNEFGAAVRAFVMSLRPGAPFAATFMADSDGYRVGDHHFPAVPIGLDDVRQCLEPVAGDVIIRPIHSSAPLRDGYSGMLLAVGHAV
jgi:hypothetical protein